MSLSALESVDDAIEATRRFLFPLDRARWFRLAVVMLFVSVGGFSLNWFPFGSPPGGDDGDAPPDQAEPGQLTPELTTELLVFIVLFVAFVVAVVLLWQIASAVMEFVFVESLGREEVDLRAYFRRNWWRGVRLFGFRLAAWLLTFGALASVLLGVGVLLGGWPPGQWGDGAVLAVILLAIPLVLGSFLVVRLLLGFTTMFVVPVMLTEERGVLSGWRRFGSTLAENPVEYFAYLVLSVLLGFGVGILVNLLLLAAFVVVAIPALFVIVPLVILIVLGLETLGVTMLLVVFLAAAVLLFVTSLVVQVPFQTFLRYYALFVLGDTNEDFDVIADTRTAVRADGGAEGDDGDDADDGGNAIRDRDAGDDIENDDAEDDAGTDGGNVGGDENRGDDEERGDGE